MKVRIISAFGGLAVLLLVLTYYDTVVLNLAVALIAVLAVYEVLHATRYLNNRILSFTALTFAFSIPFFRTNLVMRALPAICYVFILVLVSVMLRHHETIKVEQMGFMFFISLVVPFSLSTAVFMRDKFGVAIGLYYTVFALAASWSADTGAYFAGVFFGKHKLAPAISPKKTVEGAIGGAIFAAITVLVISWGYAALWQEFLGVSLTVNYTAIALVSPFLTLAGMIGDLAASVIKRQCGVKDFGQIMPGHGGVMDRFDSVLLVMPAVLILSWYLPLVRLVA